MDNGRGTIQTPRPVNQTRQDWRLRIRTRVFHRRAVFFAVFCPAGREKPANARPWDGRIGGRLWRVAGVDTPPFTRGPPKSSRP